MSFNLDEESLRQIVRGVIREMNGVGGQKSCGCANKGAPAIISSSSSQGKGIFTDVASAVNAAYEGYRQLCKGGMEARKKIIDIVKAMTVVNAKEWGVFEYNETKIYGKVVYPVR